MNSILHHWLEKQYELVPGARYAVLHTGPADTGPYEQSFSWPHESDLSTHLERVINAALRSKQAIIKTANHFSDETSEPLDALACPIIVEGQLLGVVAFEMTSRSKVMQQNTVQLIQTGLKWLETILLSSRLSAQDQLVNLIELLSAGLEEEDFQVALVQVATELAKRFECSQVSIGFVHFLQPRIKAISGNSRIDRQSNLIRAMRDAMSEAIDQGRPVVFPPLAETENVQTVHFHAQLAKLHSLSTFCSVPLVKNGKAVGALLLERPSDTPFSRNILEHLERIGLLLGPVLETRRRDERSLVAKTVDAAYTKIRHLFGPGYLMFKMSVVMIVLVIGALFMVSGQFRIAADSVIEAGLLRSVIAPQNGFIDNAFVRPGDLVSEGDLLATLDDRELLREQRKWQAQREQLLKEYRQALAQANRSEVAVFLAKRQQAEAQLMLVEQRLDRTRLTAPFDGVVVKGDLSQNLGSPVERGASLFEIAPIDNYRVVLNVDDRDIGLLKTGQMGKLRLAGIPDQMIDIRVDRITPVSVSDGQRNVFRVEAAMAAQSDLLRPGMEGVSRVDIGERKYLWIWTRKIFNQLRLTLWHWLP
jgi:multidrug resistance efflux pump